MNKSLETLLNSEMEEVLGGQASQGSCVCENGGAGSVVIQLPTQGSTDEGFSTRDV